MSEHSAQLLKRVQQNEAPQNNKNFQCLWSTKKLPGMEQEGKITHNHDNNQSIQIGLETTERMALEEKDHKTVIRNMFHMLRSIKKNMNVIRGLEDITGRSKFLYNIVRKKHTGSN